MPGLAPRHPRLIAAARKTRMAGTKPDHDEKASYFSESQKPGCIYRRTSRTGSMSLNPCTKELSRRHVLQAGLGIAAGSLANWTSPARAQSSPSPLAARAIPHSGELIPVIGLGTANEFQMQQQGERKATLKRVVDDLLAQGCKLIDTASSYGAAESVLGDLLSDQDRTKVFLATKLETGDAKAGAIEFKRSLERLRYKQVDLLQLHNV